MRELVEERVRKALVLLPYLPGLNAVEEAFTKEVKGVHLQRAGMCARKGLVEANIAVFSGVTARDAGGSSKYKGHFFLGRSS